MSLGAVYDERTGNIKREYTFIGSNKRELYLVLPGDILVFHDLNFKALFYIKRSLQLEQ